MIRVVTILLNKEFARDLPYDDRVHAHVHACVCVRACVVRVCFQRTTSSCGGIQAQAPKGQQVPRFPVVPRQETGERERGVKAEQR